LEEARRLAATDAAQFRWWALSQVGARPIGGENGLGESQHLRGIHGIVPARTRKEADQLVVVVIDQLERETIQHVCEFMKAGANWSSLVITLEPFTQETQELLIMCSRIAGGALTPGTFTSMSIAELLHQHGTKF
jgi:hypothetical protein